MNELLDPDQSKNMVSMLKDPPADNPQYFGENLNIENLTPLHASIVMFYFSFTTLMTIGLGDYAPRGIFEVALAGVGMLGGVIVLTIIKDNFITIYNFTL